MLKKVTLAVVAALATQAASAASIDFHGYMRAGFGYTSEGGGLPNTGGPGKEGTFTAPYTQTKFRLGNESTNYSEMVFGVKLYKGTDGSQFNYIANLATSFDGDADYEGSDGATPSFRLASRESYVTASGVFDGFLKGSQVWIGKRFYQRHDIHMTDAFYVGNTGMGAGIEGVDLGFGKLSYALLQSSGNDSNDTVSRHDLRLANIKLMKDTELEVGFLGAMGSPASGGTNDGNEELSYTLFGEVVSSNFYGGFNKFFVSYNTAAAAWNGVADYTSGYDNSDATLIKVIDHGFVKLSPAWEMSYVADLNVWKDTQNDTTSLKLGVRPVYSIDEYNSLSVEAGMDRVLSSDNNAHEDSTLLKLTGAYSIQAGKGYWARPQLRFYGTYAKWNDAANAWGPVGGGRFGTDKSGFIYGAQVEAWW